MENDEIVVGYDGSDAAASAAAWALTEAGYDGHRVRLVYVFEWLVMAGWIGTGVSPGVWPDDAARRSVEELIHTAAEEAAATHPGLTVHGEVVDGTPVPALEERSTRAALLVLGSRGHGGFTDLLVGSTSVAVAAHAHCPVVVVRPGTGPGGDTGTSTGIGARVDSESGPVLVGVDGSTHSVGALGFAIERAARRRVPLHVVRAWQPPPPQWRPPPLDYDRIAAAERASVTEQLDRWRQAFPDVPVTIDVVGASPAAALTEASRHAQLTVVGSRGRGIVRGMLLGSVSQQLLQHAQSPVAIVRGAGPDAPGPSGPAPPSPARG